MGHGNIVLRKKIIDRIRYCYENGIERYPLFAAASIDSMYDSRQAEMDQGNVDELNLLLSDS